MKCISLITVYNKKTLLDEMIDSARKQKNVEIDYVMIDNSSAEFSSAAQALNYGAGKSIGEVLVFLHQDIEFLADDVLEYIYDYAVENPNIVFGAAGVEDKNFNKDTKILSSMLVGPKGKENKYNTIKVPTKAFTLDECLIACHRNCFNKIKFDEKVCDGWHLYGADLCLQANICSGVEVKAVPLNVWHKSHGNADGAYFKTQNLLAIKYKKYYNVINTTNGYVYTNFLKRLAQNLYRKIKYRKV